MLDLIQRVGKINGEKKLDNPVQWYQEKFGKEPSYDTLLDELTSSQAGRRDLLANYFEPREADIDEGRKIPQAAHRAIASLVKTGYIKIIITTNFDRLIETAVYDIGFHPYVIFHESGIRSCPPPAHIQHSCIIFKIHGDYLDTQLRNTPEELARYPDLINQYLDRIFDEFGLITCGWSGEYDCAIIERLKARRSDSPYPIYVSSRGKKKPAIQELLKIPNTIPVEISDADDFFEKLSENVTFLMEHNKEPLTDELLVIRVRKYLSDTKNQIKLWELLNTEVKSVQEKNNNEILRAISKTSFTVKDLMAHFETNIKNLEIICMNVAFFGDQSYSPFFRSIIEQLMTVQEKGWYNKLVSLQYYPALLIAYISGIILLKDDKFSQLSELLLNPICYDYNERKPSISIINTRTVFRDSAEKQIDYPNAENLYAPVSEYLYHRLKDPLSTFFSNENHYSETFDLFEYLLSLIYIDQIYPDLSKGRIWSPIGRYNWKRESYYNEKTPFFEQKVEQWLHQGENLSLFKEGFFQASPERLNQCHQGLLLLLKSSKEQWIRI
ncbi:hypothetical protein KSK55_05815 [Methanospirillum purgamenti]|uniref:SIR2-like domain-containing protein n=1 Tax=Methanospirillum hungatei TaxID=2203 RepID=A0A8F5VQ51_METHU|nr:SIR2 family protein [Methanospirillum hungatei]QXO95903.1 hypothetical protein KSK55_05815 [Methanospirillum hungatei]